MVVSQKRKNRFNKNIQHQEVPRVPSPIKLARYKQSFRDSRRIPSIFRDVTKEPVVVLDQEALRRKFYWSSKQQNMVSSKPYRHSEQVTRHYIPRLNYRDSRPRIPPTPQALYKHHRSIRWRIRRKIRWDVGWQRVFNKRMERRRTRKVLVYRHLRQQNRPLIGKSIRIIRKMDFFWRRIISMPFARRLPFQLEKSPYQLTRFQRKAFYGLFEQRLQFRGLFGLTQRRLWRINRSLYGRSHLATLCFRFFRVDMLLMWLGYTATIYESWRLVRSGIIVINGKVCSKVDYVLRPYDIWTIAKQYRAEFRQVLVAKLNRVRVDNLRLFKWPHWFEFNVRILAFTYIPSLYEYHSFKLPILYNINTVGRIGKYRI